MKKIFTLLSLLLGCFSFKAFAYDVTVAKDGTGNFTTIQAAINAAPTGQTVPYKIFIKAGKYREQITVPSNKPFLEFIGEDVANTKITYGDGGGGTTTFTINANDCMLMDLTLENSQGYYSDGPQSLAIKTNNVDRIVFKNCRFISGQDTVYVNGSGKRVYFKNCYIDGNTDFIYGAAIAVFDSCIIFSRDRVDGSNGGIVTAANTPNGQAYGLVFRNCVMPNNRGITRYSLGRPWQNDAGTAANPAYNKTVFLNTTMSAVVLPTGWSTWDAGTNTSTITYAEYRSKNFDSSLIDVSQRVAWSQQLTAAQAANYYNNSNLFGTWDPYTTWTDLTIPIVRPIALANFRTIRTSLQATISFNISWPVSNVKYELFRSTDSINFSKINEFTIAPDTVVATAFTDAVPPAGTTYFYKVTTSKTGYASNTTDTIVKVNIAVPLSGDYRSVASGGWTNNVSAISTISGGAVTGVTITSSPTGYTGTPTVTFTAAPSGGTTATGTAIVTGGVVTGVNIINAGSGYTAAPTVSFSTTGVGGNSIWQRYTVSTNSWDAIVLGTSPSNTNVTISSGNVVSLNALAGITSLAVESGATFQTDGQARNFRIKGDINNNGVFGGTNPITNRVTLEMDGTSGTYNIVGSGVYNFAMVRALTGVQNLIINIGANLTLSGTLQAWYASTTATDQGANNVTFNINPGVTVTASSLHSTTATNTAATFGNYTYNINGILDLSGSTALTGLIPNATASTKTMTVNVNGILRTGTQLRTVSTASGASESKVVLNIGANGLVDAIKANTTFAITPNYFIVSGNGILERYVSTSPVIFPIGTSATAYNPVTLSNSGAADNFSVNVKSTFSNPVPDANRIVNKEWNITPDNLSGTPNIAASFGWQTADQAAGFNPAGGISVIHFRNSAWMGTAATVTGSGTLASPYIATASGFTTFSPLAITNSSALPLKLVSFKAACQSSQVNTTWTTTNEEGTKQFEVERSPDGRSFTFAGRIAAQNTAGTHHYQFTDAAPLKGISYYRLKMTDKDGRVSYSSIVAVNGGAKGVLLVYPNPVKDWLQVLHNAAGNKAFITILSAKGKTLLRQNIAANATQSTIAVAALAAGNYTLQLSDNTQQNTVRFTKL